MDRKILQQRTKQFHIDVIRLCELLPRNAAGFEIAKQIIRCAGSVGANYRASAGPNPQTISYTKLRL
jgi:four helix bundle protein